MVRFNPNSLTSKISLTTKSKMKSYLQRSTRSKAIKKQKPIPMKRKYSLINDGFRKLVVALKFGSLADMSQVRMSNAQIAKELNCTPQQVQYIVAKYKARGSFESHIKNRGRSRRHFTAE